MSDDRIIAFCDWVVETSLLFGASVSTAYTVAGFYAKLLEEQEQRSDGPAEDGER